MAGPSKVSQRPKVFYGWYVIGVSMGGAFLAGSLSQLFMSVMLQPISAEMGWRRTQITGAVTMGTLLSGLLSPFVGKLAFRYSRQRDRALGPR
jgi:hypothetical protein